MAVGAARVLAVFRRHLRASLQPHCAADAFANCNVNSGIRATRSIGFTRV